MLCNHSKMKWEKFSMIRTRHVVNGLVSYSTVNMLQNLRWMLYICYLCRTKRYMISTWGLEILARSDLWHVDVLPIKVQMMWYQARSCRFTYKTLLFHIQLGLVRERACCVKMREDGKFSVDWQGWSNAGFKCDKHPQCCWDKQP